MSEAKLITVNLIPADKLLKVRYYREVPLAINQSLVSLQSLEVHVARDGIIMLSGKEYHVVSRSSFTNQSVFDRLKKDYDLPETIEEAINGSKQEFLSKKTKPYLIKLIGFAMMSEESDIVDEVEEN